MKSARERPSTALNFTMQNQNIDPKPTQQRDRSQQAVGHYAQGGTGANHPNHSFFNLNLQQNQTMIVPNKLLKQAGKYS